MLSSMQGQGCTIIQPAGDGLRVNRVLYCSALSLMLESSTAVSFEKIMLIANTSFLGHAIINMGSESFGNRLFCGFASHLELGYVTYVCVQRQGLYSGC